MPWPSTLLRWILERLLGPGEEDVLGDLEEELDREMRRGGRMRAEAWYGVEALSLIAAVLEVRVRRRPVPPDTAIHARSARDHDAKPVGDDRRTQGDRRAGGGERMMESLRETRHTLRGLTRDMVTTSAIVLTLAVTIGATTTIVAVADAAFLRPLPYPDAQRLVRLYSGSRDEPEAVMALSPLDVRDLRSFDAVIDELGVWTVGETVHLTEGDEPRRLEAPRASANLFGILGIEPALGRFFLPEEEEPGSDDAVVLSHGLWVTAFGADPAVLEGSVRLDGRPHRVVGVAPPSGTLPSGVDAWRALALGPEWYDPGRWGWQFLEGVARLQPGVDPETVSPFLTARLAESVPGRVERGQTRVARTLRAERVGATGPALLLLMGAVGLLLILACANVMNMTLVRAERRVREFALRRALGSGSTGLVRLVGIETVILAALGGLAGLALAYAGAQALGHLDLVALPYLDAVRIDLRVALAAFCVTALTAAVFGLLPIAKALGTDPQSVLRASGGRVGTSRRVRRMQDGLVVVQVALACTLLASVGLSASAFLALQGRDPGFRPEGVLVATVELPADTYGDGDPAAVYRSLAEGIGGLPDVARVGAVAFLPLSGVGWSASIEPVDPDFSVTDPDPSGNMRPVMPGYFRTLEIPLVDGRVFTDADDQTAPPVVIVDETLARRYWPGASPVGRQVMVGALSRDAATVVGVVGSVPDESLSRPGSGNVYFPALQRASRRLSFVVRGGGGDPSLLAPAVRSAIRDVDARIPVVEMATLEDRLRGTLAAPRAALLLLVAFGVVALLLAAVGVYGVLGYRVALRGGEIGTRMALGATPRRVRGAVVRDAMRLWLAGAAVGGAGALGAGGVLARSVPGVESADPLPYVLALAGLGAVALVAAFVPALRATEVDPAKALRAE